MEAHSAIGKSKEKRALDTNPPKRQCRKWGGGRGRPRPNSARKKGIPKEITVTPVKLVSHRLGKYQANGPKEFVSLSGVDTGTSEGLTLKTLENVMLGHFLGLTREQAVDRYLFYILKTLRGPKLTMDSHITGKQFYFYWKAGVEMDSSDEEEVMRDSLDPLPELELEPLTSLSASNTAANNAPLRSVHSPAPSVVLSKKATDQRRRGQLRGLALAVPSSLPVRPSAVINLGKSIPLPPVRQTELPVAITSFTIASDWGSIETEGPLHCVLDVQGFPAQPFGSGTFQNAFKATCIVPNKFLDLSGRYVFKQQKLEGPLTTEAVKGLSSEDMDLMLLIVSLFFRVLPSLFVKMTGQFPSCGILEHEIEGTWQKFLNNDGLEMGGKENQFKLKALAFAHWTFNKFDGRLLVCDLQGADYTLSDLEIASTDGRLFGIGNLSCTAHEGFKSSHQCNVYCIALELPAFDRSSRSEQSNGSQEWPLDPTSPEVFLLSSGEEDRLPSLTTLMASAKKQESQTTCIQQHLPNNKLDCGICLSKKIEVTFYKCGHIYCCENCTFKLNGTCPICRQRYDEIVKIYLR